MFKNLFKLKSDYQLLLVIGILVLLVAVFWPRDTPLISTSFSAHLGNLGGKISLEAYEGFEDSKGKTFALFYAPWCPHCTNFLPEWDNATKKNTNQDVKMVKINCDDNPDMAEKHDVKSFPTVYFLPYGLNNPKDRIEYKGDRKGEALLAFVSNK